MNARQRRALLWPSVCFLFGLSIVTAPAQIRSLTLGIDVNCPPGLGECWGLGIREGVAKFEGIETAARDADGATQTAEVRTRGGRLIGLDALSRHIEAIQLGARLRGAEALVDGCMELHNGQAFLSIGQTGEKLRLLPLASKTQFDRRTGRQFPATSAESKACETLLRSWAGERQAVRLIGPLRAASAREDPALEVREAYCFSQEAPVFDSLTIGIAVSSPYGLGEPWAEVRARLLSFPGIASVADLPDSDASTANIEAKEGRLPDLSGLDQHLRRAGLGAHATGFEARIAGRLIRANGQLALKIPGTDHPLLLAPLTRKVQWDHRHQRPVAITPTERDAYARLANQASIRPRPIQVIGPITQTGDGEWTLLEVREFDLKPRASNWNTRAQNHDTTAPAPIDAPGAILRANGDVWLDWDASQEPDAAGYHVYRSATGKGRFVKLTKAPLAASEFLVTRSRTASAGHYAVSVVDKAGNESARSPASDARPPSAPKHLSARPGDQAVHLEWDPPDVSDLDSYSVRRSESPGGPYAVINVGVLRKTYTDHGAKNGRTYYYVVTAVDTSSNESPFSNECSAAPGNAARGD